MIADFNPAPMAPDQVQPLWWRMLLGGRTGEIVTGLSAGGPGPFLGAVAAHHDQGAGKGEVGGQRFDGKGVELPGLDASVTGLAGGKKGVPDKASRLWARLSKPGWLPLIWNK